MLVQIDLANLVTIQKLHLDIKSGTTVLTGETGAGKSILIDAIELALGGRATGDIVRAGQEKADINVTFDIRQLANVQTWLLQNDLNDYSGECVIRRTVQKDGRSKSYINGTPTTLHLLRELSDLLINIHGQHEHQSLFKSETQRDMLDKFAGHVDLVTTVSDLSNKWNKIAAELENLRKVNHDRTSRSEFLRFQLRELEELQLTECEFSQLEKEHQKLANSGELLQNLTLAINKLSEDENNNALSILHHTQASLEHVQIYDTKIQTFVESIRSASIQLSDVVGEIRHHLDDIDLDPERLMIVEQRIGVLFDMARKYKIKPDELFELKQKIAAELNELDTSDERLIELEKELEILAKQYNTAAKQLSDSRLKASKKLTKEITAIVHELSLPHAKFHIEFKPDEVSTFSPHGLEKIIFQITTNIGQPLQPLTKVASGGELSRISLAIHMATAEQHTIPTLIFDEVDVGISGGTAEIVGKLLRRLGNTHQLLCITHLPQVAAQGHHHLYVEKRHEKDATYTHIQDLNSEQKIQEIARMLGGVAITKKTIEHAKEMLEVAEAAM